MLGLINRSFQFFLIDTWGVDVWRAIASELAMPYSGFESMLIYDAGELDRLIGAASTLLERPRESLMEDLGTYVAAHARNATVRRLLRFSGTNFAEFLGSVDELADRGRLVLPDLDLPELELTDQGAGVFRLRCRSEVAGAGHVIMGLLRAMADDYGALVLLEHLGEEQGAEVLSIQIADQALYEARPFSLGISV